MSAGRAARVNLRERIAGLSGWIACATVIAGVGAYFIYERAHDAMWTAMENAHFERVTARIETVAADCQAAHVRAAEAFAFHAGQHARLGGSRADAPDSAPMRPKSRGSE